VSALNFGSSLVTVSDATYVLSGDWKRMVGHSKAYLRLEYRNSYTKVVHNGDWLSRVRYAL
jgi:hypothetical protein